MPLEAARRVFEDAADSDIAARAAGREALMVERRDRQPCLGRGHGEALTRWQRLVPDRDKPRDASCRAGRHEPRRQVRRDQRCADDDDDDRPRRCCAFGSVDGGSRAGDDRRIRDVGDVVGSGPSSDFCVETVAESSLHRWWLVVEVKEP